MTSQYPDVYVWFMTHPTAHRPSLDLGDQLSHRAAHALITVQHVAANAYTVTIAYPTTGQPVSALSRSWPTEDEARTMARNAAVYFSIGTIETALAAIL